MTTPKTLTGLDILVREKFSRLSGKRIAILAHAASVDRSFRHVIDRVLDHPSVKLVRILAPEHGLRGAPQDMDSVASSTDKILNIEVVSLYGGTYDSLFPKPEHLRDIDTLLVDLPDVGSRYYTYAQTMAFCMKLAGELGVEVMVCDRPNPINGVDIEGAPLVKSCRSFCGYTPILNRHALTIGEWAIVYQRGFGEGDDAREPYPCKLEIVRCEGWKRSQYLDETDLPWVLPSPNMPTLDAAIIYPGGCLFEATKMSEARGTTKPFEFVGAPYINANRWIEATFKQGLELEGAILRPIVFLPQFQKCAKIECCGVQIHITNRAAFKPYRWSLALIAAAKTLYPTDFQWRTDPYEFVDRVPAIDLLHGNPRFRELVESGKTLESLDKEMAIAESKYRSEISPFLLYS